MQVQGFLVEFSQPPLPLSRCPHLSAPTLTRTESHKKRSLRVKVHPQGSLLLRVKVQPQGSLLHSLHPTISLEKNSKIRAKLYPLTSKRPRPDAVSSDDEPLLLKADTAVMAGKVNNFFPLLLPLPIPITRCPHFILLLLLQEPEAPENPG